MSRNIEDLSLEMKDKVLTWIEMMHGAGIDFIITCTKRSQEEQLELWKLGREWKDGKWVTTDRKAQRTWTLNSNHKDGNAFDFVITVFGKPDWNMTRKDLWDKAVEFGKSLGMTQVIGKNGKVKEYAHLQLEVV